MDAQAEVDVEGLIAQLEGEVRSGGEFRSSKRYCASFGTGMSLTTDELWDKAATACKGGEGNLGATDITSSQEYSTLGKYLAFLRQVQIAMQVAPPEVFPLARLIETGITIAGLPAELESATAQKSSKRTVREDLLMVKFFPVTRGEREGTVVIHIHVGDVIVTDCGWGPLFLALKQWLLDHSPRVE